MSNEPSDGNIPLLQRETHKSDNVETEIVVNRPVSV